MGWGGRTLPQGDTCYEARGAAIYHQFLLLRPESVRLAGDKCSRILPLTVPATATSIPSARDIHVRSIICKMGIDIKLNTILVSSHWAELSVIKAQRYTPLDVTLNLAAG